MNILRKNGSLKVNSKYSLVELSQKVSLSWQLLITLPPLRNAARMPSPRYHQSLPNRVYERWSAAWTRTRLTRLDLYVWNVPGKCTLDTYMYRLRNAIKRFGFVWRLRQFCKKYCLNFGFYTATMFHDRAYVLDVLSIVMINICLGINFNFTLLPYCKIHFFVIVKANNDSVVCKKY